MVLIIFLTGALSFSYHYFGYGSGPIHFKNVHCTGDEESVLQCSHNTINTYCSHYEDAGIACPREHQNSIMRKLL